MQIFESSRFAVEVGAAIHLPPNVNGVLRRFGLKPETFGANDTEWVRVRNTPSSRLMPNQIYPAGYRFQL